MLVQHSPWVDAIAPRLGHLLPFAIQNQPQTGHILKGHAIKQHGGDGVQRVKPAARLVHRLADVISGKLLLELGVVFKRMMPLRYRHRTRIKPTIDHFGYAAHELAGCGIRKRDLVHVGTVQIETGKVAGCQFGEFGQRTHQQRLPIFVNPDRQRRTPEALAPQRPIDVVFQPVAEAPVTNVTRIPVDGLVQLHQLLLVFRGSDVPGAARVIKQRRVATPAEWICVQINARFEQ